MADLGGKLEDVAGQFGGKARMAAVALAQNFKGSEQAREMGRLYDMKAPEAVRGVYRGRDVPQDKDMIKGLPGRSERSDMDTVRRSPGGRVSFFELPFGRAYAAKGFLLGSGETERSAVNVEKQKNHLATASDRDLVYIGGRTAESIKSLILKEIRQRTDFMLDSKLGREKNLMGHYRKEFPGRDENGVRQAVAEKLFKLNLDFDGRNGNPNNIKSIIAKWSGVREDKVPSLSDVDRGALSSARRGLSAISVEVARREVEKGVDLGFADRVGQVGIQVDKRLADIPLDIPIPSSEKSKPKARTRGSDSGLGM